MSALAKVFKWGDTHHPGWLDFLRIALGGIIFYKGLVFAREGHDLKMVVDGNDSVLWSIFLQQFVPLISFACGVLIVIGLLTRLAVMFQIPIVFAAVIFNGSKISLFDSYLEFGLAIIVLAFLILFLILGSGPFSADEYMKNNNNG
jgi:uncharacterized membrane protein YphA (DoxX/SURF4 family)